MLTYTPGVGFELRPLLVLIIPGEERKKKKKGEKREQKAKGRRRPDPHPQRAAVGSHPCVSEASLPNEREGKKKKKRGGGKEEKKEDVFYSPLYSQSGGERGPGLKKEKRGEKKKGRKDETEMGGKLQK